MRCTLSMNCILRKILKINVQNNEEKTRYRERDIYGIGGSDDDRIYMNT